MEEDRQDGSTRRKPGTSFEASGGNNAFHTGSGNQNIVVRRPWAQAPVVACGAIGVVAGIILMPKASGGQHGVYCSVLVACATAAVVCLWFAFDGERRPLSTLIVLVVLSVLSTATAAGYYQLLAAHGDLPATVTLLGNKPLSGQDPVHATFEGSAARTHLRIRVGLKDHYSNGTCASFSRVAVASLVNGTPQESITLRAGQWGDIDLHGFRDHGQLSATVLTDMAGKNCLLDLQLDAGVLHDNVWWL